jgi:3-hydroxybutyryl-CoA dehydrogenase
MTTMNIGVVGGGLMGHGIAYLLAAAGHTVRICEPSVEIRASVPERVSAICDLLEEDKALLKRVSVHDTLAAAVADTGFVFEAAPEKLPLKQQIFADLEKLTARDTILASNSSALPSTEIGRHLEYRDRVVGTHFWNPPHLVPLVEVIQTEWTSDATIQKTMDLLRDAGRSPVHVRRDIPGFIGNRLQHALKREAIALVAAGVADAETIDTVIKDGFGARLAVLGTFEQTDLVGANLTLDIHETLLEHLDRSTEPHPFLRELVAQGKVGMRTGEGFRKWTPEQAQEVRDRLSRYLAEAAKARNKAAKANR